MVLSIDRFMAIYLHLRYQELVTHGRVVAVVFSKWAFSAFLSTIMLWVPMNICVVTYVIVEFGCLALTTFLNYKIYLSVRRHRNQIQALQVQQVDHLNDEIAMMMMNAEICTRNILRVSRVSVLLFTTYL